MESFFPTSLRDAAKRQRVYITFEVPQTPLHLEARVKQKDEIGVK